MFSLVLFSAMLSTTENSVEAKMITDDQNHTFDLPDKYFLDWKEYHFDTYIQDYMNEYAKIQYYLDNPDEDFQDPTIAQKFTNCKNIREYMQKGFEINPGYWGSTQNMLQFMKIRYSDPQDSALDTIWGGLETDDYQFEDIGYTAVLNPTDFTIYNATGEISVTKALEASFKQWERVKPLHFRLVDSSKDARMVVLGPKDYSDSTFDKGYDFDGALIINSTYHNCLIHATMLLSQKMVDSDGSDPKLVHTVMHELGHAVGMKDVY